MFSRGVGKSSYVLCVHFTYTYKIVTRVSLTNIHICKTLIYGYEKLITGSIYP